MTPSPKTFATHAGISSLCTVFRARLMPYYEEGIARHFVHRPCQQVVFDPQGRLAPDVDVHLALVFGLERLSPLRDDMEEDLRRLHEPPFESLLLDMPLGTLRDPMRPRFMAESSDRFLGLSDAGVPIILASVSHRRRIGSSLVIRHYPVAVFGSSPFHVGSGAGLSGLLRSSLPAMR